MTTQYEVILVSLLQTHPFRIIVARVLHCPDIVEGCSVSGRADLIIAPFTLFSLSFLFFIKHNPPLYSTKATCSKDNFCFKRIVLFEISSSPSSIDHEPRKKKSQNCSPHHLLHLLILSSLISVSFSPPVLIWPSVPHASEHKRFFWRHLLSLVNWICNKIIIIKSSKMLNGGLVLSILLNLRIILVDISQSLWNIESLSLLNIMNIN